MEKKETENESSFWDSLKSLIGAFLEIIGGVFVILGSIGYWFFSMKFEPAVILLLVGIALIKQCGQQ